MTEDEMAGWHYPLNGHEFEQTQGDDEGQESLVCSSHGVAESDTTELLSKNSPSHIGLEFFRRNSSDVLCKVLIFSKLLFTWLKPISAFYYHYSYFPNDM